MKHFRFLAVMGLSLVASQAALAVESLNEFPLKTLPVLINVDSAGKITSASPAMQLPPNIERLLRNNLDEMVSGPAHWKGKAIDSQCVINVALQTSPRDDGKYDAGFTYLSAQPVPMGHWHWVNQDGHRLMLASEETQLRGLSHFGAEPYVAPPGPSVHAGPPPMPTVTPPPPPVHSR